MPKIEPVKDTSSEIERESQSLFDIIFPKSLRYQSGLSDAEASVIYGVWKNSPVGAFVLPGDTDKKLVNSLKIKGYLAGFGSDLELTDKGKKVIVEMVTHEPNAFEKHAKDVSYSNIRSKSASRRPRQAFFKKKASLEKPSKVFNLRQESLKRMGMNDANNGLQ
jgi:hypothetical protein